MKKVLFFFTICAMLMAGYAQRNFQQHHFSSNAPLLDRNSTWLTWADESNLSGGIIYTDESDPVSLMVAQRFSTSDLASYNGYNLTKVAFYLGDEYVGYDDEYGYENYFYSSGSFQVFVYQGGSYTSGTVMNPGTLVASQTVSYANYESWNTVTLNTPVTINSSQELWIGVAINNAAGTLMSFDGNTATTGKGALIYDYDDYTWYDGNSYGFNFTVGNWGIKGYAEDPANPGSAGGDIDFVVEFIDDAYNQNTVTEWTVPYGSDFVPLPVVWNSDFDPTVDFEGTIYFNMYLDGTLIGTDNSPSESIASGSGIFWNNFVVLTASEIAAYNYYGTHEFCIEAYADAEWNEVYPYDNTGCLTVTFENSNSSSNSYTINVLNGDGSVTPGGTVTVSEGGSQTFTINVPVCNVLQNVLVDGISVLNDVVNNTYTFTNVTSNHSFQAIYEPTRYTINATCDANGTVTPPTSSVACGDNILLTITPNSGYEIARVTDNTIDVTGSVSNGTYSITNITDNHSVYVTFTPTQGGGGQGGEGGEGGQGGEGGNVAITDYAPSCITIFPNPASSQINLQSANIINLVEIYDLAGKRIVSMEANSTQVVVNVENLTAGLYFVKATAEGKTLTTKFVKK